MNSDELLGELGEAHAAQTRAEARVLNLMVEAADSRLAEAELEESASRRRYLVSCIADEIAVETNSTVNFVQQSLFRARLVRSRLPRTWAAFEAGRITAYAIREVGRHAAKLVRDESFEVLDHHCAVYAVSHTGQQTSAWAKRRVATLEPKTLDEREAEAMAGRDIGFSYDDEGGAEMWLKLLTQKMLEIERSLQASLDTKAAGDHRTVGQFLADEVHARATGDIDGSSLVSTEIMVAVQVSTLAGLDDDPGATLDERVLLPASVVRELAAQEGTVFHRVVTDPFGGILDVTRLGRFFPPSTSCREVPPPEACAPPLRSVTVAASSPGACVPPRAAKSTTSCHGPKARPAATMARSCASGTISSRRPESFTLSTPTRASSGPFRPDGAPCHIAPRIRRAASDGSPTTPSPDHHCGSRHISQRLGPPVGSGCSTVTLNP